MAPRFEVTRNRVPVALSLKVGGRTVAFQGEAIDGPARLDELRPVMRAMDDAVLAIAVEAVEAQGSAVSCAKGCSACCKQQPVPITPAEARLESASEATLVPTVDLKATAPRIG